MYYYPHDNTWTIFQAELSKLRRPCAKYVTMKPLVIEQRTSFGYELTRWEVCSNEFQALQNANWYVTDSNWFKISAFPKGEGPYTVDELYQFVKEHNLKGLGLIKK